MGLYELGISAPMTEKEKLEAAISVYRANGENDKANALAARLQTLEMTRPRPTPKARKKRGHAVVIPGTPEVYRHSPDFPIWPLFVLGGLAGGSYLMRKGGR